jgi:hypothetical protein
VKGLIFNLLDSMARNSGCADEAWDLVMEFVASETDHEAESDTCLSCFDEAESLLAFETPAEAMIQCLGGEPATARESASEFPEMSMLSEAEEWAAESVPPMVDADTCSHHSIQATEGFSHDLLNLLEQLLAEALSGDSREDEGDDIEEYSPMTPAQRRTSH